MITALAAGLIGAVLAFMFSVFCFGTIVFSLLCGPATKPFEALDYGEDDPGVDLDGVE